jgi:hypothetical protein
MYVDKRFFTLGMGEFFRPIIPLFRDFIEDNLIRQQSLARFFDDLLGAIPMLYEGASGGLLFELFFKYVIKLSLSDAKKVDQQFQLERISVNSMLSLQSPFSDKTHQLNFFVSSADYQWNYGSFHTQNRIYFPYSSHFPFLDAIYLDASGNIFLLQLTIQVDISAKLQSAFMPSIQKRLLLEFFRSHTPNQSIFFVVVSTKKKNESYQVAIQNAKSAHEQGKKPRLDQVLDAFCHGQERMEDSLLSVVKDVFLLDVDDINFCFKKFAECLDAPYQSKDAISRAFLEKSR